MSLRIFAGATSWLVVPLAEMGTSGREADTVYAGGEEAGGMFWLGYV